VGSSGEVTRDSPSGYRARMKGGGPRVVFLERSMDGAGVPQTDELKRAIKIGHWMILV